MLMVFRSRSRFPAATWHGTYRGKHPKPALLPRLSPSLDKARALALHPTHTRWPTHDPGWLITLTNHTLGRIARVRSCHFPASISLLRDIWAYLGCFLLLKEPLLENFSFLRAASSSMWDPPGKGQPPTPEAFTPGSLKPKEISSMVRGCNGTVQLPSEQNLNLDSWAQKGA